ncbi:hypothetical protein [Halopenitus sp. POP-27]|uniref:hypothetical protein n=1 Tax=Halopenitus sp. POP-27 TaxID=2994425 RepID=UPI002468E97E|nr:hypothetical protein [Halopenitus sp. POP-27]
MIKLQNTAVLGTDPPNHPGSDPERSPSIDDRGDQVVAVRQPSPTTGVTGRTAGMSDGRTEIGA